VARRPIRQPSGVPDLVRRVGSRALLGLAAAGLTLALDAVVPPSPLAVESARTLLSAMVSAVVTAGVFSLWMRTVAIGLVSDHFSPRTLVVFLDDRFQVRLAGWMAGGLVLQIVLLAAMPDDDALGAPGASVAVSAVVGVVAFGAVLFAVNHAVQSVDLTRLVSRLADEVRRVAELQPRGTATEPPELPDTTVQLRAEVAGWVQSIDRPALLEALPDGARARLLVRVGSFVAAGNPLVRVSADGADEDAMAAAVVILGDQRSTEDLGLALSQLVDVADHSLAQSGADTATAHEALLQFSAVCSELIERGLPPCHLHDEQRDRWLVDDGAWDVADHLQSAVERLRGPASADPLGARHLAGVLATLRDHARDLGDERTASAMHRQLDHLVSLAESEGAIDDDLAELRESAR
jgi:uncharacterized membrane protein